MNEWKGPIERGFQWGHLNISLSLTLSSDLFFILFFFWMKRVLLWCFSPSFPLTPVWIYPFGSVRFQNGSLRRRSTHPLWRERRRRWRKRWTGRRERGRPGCRRRRRCRPRSRWAEDVQAIDGPESPDYGHLQPQPCQTELFHCQPLPLHLPRGQSHQEVCEENNRVAISFLTSSTTTHTEQVHL